MRRSPASGCSFLTPGRCFLKALEGVRSDSEKERITGSLLKRVFYERLQAFPAVTAIVMGTNYNDTLYGAAMPVKPPIGSEQTYATLEPIRALFKSEVKRLGERLSMPKSIMERQPFPAAGLASRIMGLVTPQKLSMLREANAFFTEEISRAGQDKRLWQYYAALSDNPDGRQGYAVVLRACQASDGEAYAARLPYDLIERVTGRILRDIPPDQARGVRSHTELPLFVSGVNAAKTRDTVCGRASGRPSNQHRRGNACFISPKCTASATITSTSTALRKPCPPTCPPSRGR